MRFPGYYFISIIVLLLYGTVYSQEKDNSVYGYVFDKSTGEPIEDVNVYLSNTTWGSSTNKDGYYRIRQIPSGIQELVVTIVGYKYETKNILVKADSRLKFNFYLQPIIYETEATLIEGSVPTEWLRDLEFFKYYFLGKTKFARECIIENEAYLEFSKPNNTFFIATSDRPLIIINKALGFKIECVLISFSYNKDNDRWRWSIKPKFTELESDDKNETEDWEINRRNSHLGSLYHFLKSFRSQQLKEEGFDIYMVARAGEIVPRQMWHSTIIDYEEFIEPGILPTEKKLHFTNFMHVVYENEYVSWIGLNYADITLDEYGYPEENNPYVIFGEWAHRGVADLLPKNYEVK